MRKGKWILLASVMVLSLALLTACRGNNKNNTNDMVENPSNGTGTTTTNEIPQGGNENVATDNNLANDTNQTTDNKGGVGNAVGDAVDNAGETVGDTIKDMTDGVDHVADDVTGNTNGTANTTTNNSNP